MFAYKGFVGKVEYDDEAKILFGRVINTRDVITFQSSSVDDIEEEHAESVSSDMYVSKFFTCIIDQPFSGRNVFCR